MSILATRSASQVALVVRAPHSQARFSGQPVDRSEVPQHPVEETDRAMAHYASQPGLAEEHGRLAQTLAWQFTPEANANHLCEILRKINPTEYNNVIHS